MSGAGLQLSRCNGHDRFYNPAKSRSSDAHDSHRAQNDDVVMEKPVCFADKPVKPVLSNLERFLESIKPCVPAQHFSKMTMESWRTCDSECRPYFELGDLWESFKEWSAYGAGVPLVLNETDGVVQYYVPYLSAIQIYGNPMKSSANSRQADAESDSDFRDSSSDGSSDCEPETVFKYSWDPRSHNHQTNDISVGLNMLSLRDQDFKLQEDFSSDDSETMNSNGCLLFEYLEHNPPYSREPLADKISDLALRYPKIKTLRSCDLLPSSWISVAWYPIYRIPTGPTLRDLDACFLTFHTLHTPIEGSQNIQAPNLSCVSEVDGIPKMSLPVFGLASYKLKGSLWTSTGESDCQLSQSLFQAADGWLRFLQVTHPDFQFFCRW